MEEEPNVSGTSYLVLTTAHYDGQIKGKPRAAVTHAGDMNIIRYG
jgi:hypothetical protein